MLHEYGDLPFWTKKWRCQLAFKSSIENSMGGGKGKDVNYAKLITNFINILNYKTNHLKNRLQAK
jgi:hypothetical protein